jgi:hypothetical protein
VSPSLHPDPPALAGEGSSRSVASGRGALRDEFIRFIREIGIEVREVAPGAALFLPGLDIRRGAIVVDRARWLHPGDILHEAGHLAVATPAERSAETLSPSPADEMAAIAWSYAAAVHLGHAAEIVFHADGYRGGGPSLSENFSAGRYVGAPLLDYYGMAVEPRRVKPGGPPAYPHMLRWLR